MKDILVFILDSNPVQGNFLKYNLNSYGMTNVMLFHHPEECLNSAIKKKTPRFIIADTEIKGMTDLEFLNSARNIDPSIKVLFFSENDDAVHISRLIDAGATDYIVRDGIIKNRIRELTSNLEYLIKSELFSR
jgi:DNA-binding NarL/FixJ family response regulator